MNENTMTNDTPQVKPKSAGAFLRDLLAAGQGVRDGVTYTVEDGEWRDLRAFTSHDLSASGYTGPALHAIRWLAKRIDPTLRVLSGPHCLVCGAKNPCEHYVARRESLIVAANVRDVWVLIDRDDHVRAAEANVSAVNAAAVGLDLATEHNEYDHGTYRTYVSLNTGVRVDCVSVPARECCDCHGLLIEHVGCPSCDGEIPWGEVQTRHDLFKLGDGPLSPSTEVK